MIDAEAWKRTFISGIALVALMTLPMLLVLVPPLVDLPAHMSRYYVQMNIDQNPLIARFFAFEWRFVPNLGMDMIVVALTPAVGLFAATRIACALIIITTGVGIIWIAREVHDRIPATSIAALPLIYSYPLIYGFVNSCLSMGLALLAFAWWLTLTRQGRIVFRTLAFAIIAPCLLIAHLYGLGVLGLLIGGHVLANELNSRTRIVALGRQIAVACLPIAWPLALLLVWNQGGAATTGSWPDVRGKAVYFVSLLRDRYMLWDLASTALLLVVAALPVLARDRFRFTPTLFLPAALLWAAALLLPSDLMGSNNAAGRIFPVALIVTMLSVSPRQNLPAWTKIAAYVFVMARTATTLMSFLTWDAQFRDEIRALDVVPKGARIAAFPLRSCDQTWSPPRFMHVQALATVNRDAFVNNQFASVAGQLLSIRIDANPQFATWPLVANELFATPCTNWQSGMPSLPDTLSRLDWRGMDYLWLIGAPTKARPSKPFLKPVWQNDQSVLYKVENTIGQPKSSRSTASAR